MTDARPLTVGQEALWLLNRLQPEEPGYHLVMPARIRGELRTDWLVDAVRAVVTRHDMLRSRFQEFAGRPMRVVDQPDMVRVVVRDLPDVGDEQLRELVKQERTRPFQLAETGAFRVTLFRGAQDVSLLVLVLHHIAADAQSQWLVLRDLLVALEAAATGRPPDWPELTVGYDDYARREQELLADTGWKAAKAEFWQQVIAGADAAALPADGQVAKTAARGMIHELRVPDKVVSQVDAAARQAGVTPFAFTLGVLQSLLYRHIGHSPFLIGCPSSTRYQRDMRNVVGYFVNPLMLRADIDGQSTFLDVVTTASSSLRRAMAHGAYPYPLVAGGMGRGPLFRVACTWIPLHALEPAFEFPDSESSQTTEVTYRGWRITLLDIPQQEGQFDLSVMLLRSKNRLRANIQYAADSYQQATIERFADQLVRLLGAAAADPGQRVSEAGLVAADEMRWLIGLGSGDP